jgi:hypothetical protein
MTSQRGSQRNTESLEDRESIIFSRIQMLAAVFSKKCPDELVSVFKAHLNRFPVTVLMKAFSRAETELERFPTPRILASMCGEAMPSGMWRYNFQPGHDSNGVECLIDPDPMCDSCRKPRSEHPNQACACFTDEREAKYMYRPQDCFEGRAFLYMLKEVAGK